MCQGGTLLTGAPAAASGRGGGEPSGVRGARYSTGPRIGRAGSGCVRRPPSPMPRQAPRRMRGLEAGLPSEGGGSEKVDPPPKGPRIHLGRPGITHCHSSKNVRVTSLRAGDVARPLALPPKLFPNDPHSCEYATKEGGRALLQGRCSANVHLSEGPDRHRSCCDVQARLWRRWSPACEELSRLLASQFGWVRPVRSAQGAAREGEGC